MSVSGLIETMRRLGAATGAIPSGLAVSPAVLDRLAEAYVASGAPLTVSVPPRHMKTLMFSHAYGMGAARLQQILRRRFVWTRMALWDAVQAQLS